MISGIGISEMDPPPLLDTDDVGPPAAAAKAGAINYPIPIPAATGEPLPDIPDVETAASAAAGSPDSDPFFDFLSTTPEYGDGGGAGDKSPPLNFEELESFTGVADNEAVAAANTLVKINSPTVGGGGAANFNEEDFPVEHPVLKRAAAENKKTRRVKSKKMQKFTTFDPKTNPMQVIKNLHEILKAMTIDVSQCTVHSLQEPKSDADKQIVSNLEVKHKRTEQNIVLGGISTKQSPTGYFGGYDLNLQGLLEIIAGYADGYTLDFILSDIKRDITHMTENSHELCTRLGIPSAYSTETPVENKFTATMDALSDRIAVGLDFVETAGSISYLINVSKENTVLVRDDTTREFHLRVIDNSQFRCPDKTSDFSMNSFLPKKQYTVNKIVSESYKPRPASNSQILTGADAFYNYEHYFTALRTAIEFVTESKIQFIDDVDAATTAYKKQLLVNPIKYGNDLQNLRFKYAKMPGKYTSNDDFIKEKQELDARALDNVFGLRYTALLTAAINSGVHTEEIAERLRDLYQKSVGAYCTGVGREVPKMPISMFASFADLCV
jgi:hypothetical protein